MAPVVRVFGSMMRPSGLAVTAAGLVTAAAAIWLARVSVPAFAVIGVLFLGLIAYVAGRWPRAAIVLVALSAILDRYVVAGLLPPSLGIATHLSSEALLGAVGIVLTWRAWRTDRLVPAVRHSASIFLGLFVALGVLSAVVNGVGAEQTVAGLVFTLDAALLFYLVRMVGFTVRQALTAIGALVGLLSVAGIIAILQALVGPDIFGLTALIGRFGEAHRLASIFGDPNVFAALISASVPFTVVAAARAPVRRDRFVAASIACVLMLPLWLSLSRGGWLGMVIGFSVATLVLDRRAFLVGIAVLGITFGVAATMPRDLAVAKSQRPDLVGSTLNRAQAVATSSDLRIMFLRNGLPILRRHAILGVGPGRYGGAVADLLGTPVYAQYRTTALFRQALGQKTVDDFWLHIFVEAGIVGGLTLVGAILSVLIGIYRAAKASAGARRIVLVGIAAACTSLMVNAVTTMLLEANSVAFVFWFLLGLGSLIATSPPSELATPEDLPQGA